MCVTMGRGKLHPLQGDVVPCNDILEGKHHVCCYGEGEAPPTTRGTWCLAMTSWRESTMCVAMGRGKLHPLQGGRDAGRSNGGGCGEGEDRGGKLSLLDRVIVEEVSLGLWVQCRLRYSVYSVYCGIDLNYCGLLETDQKKEHHKSALTCINLLLTLGSER